MEEMNGGYEGEYRLDLFNKLGRIYGKKINKSAKKSPCFLARKSGS